MISHATPNIARLLTGLCLSLCLLWTQLLADDYVLAMLEKIRQRYGEEAYQNINRLNEVFSQIAGASEMTKVGMVNDFTNQHVLFVDDSTLWGKEDYWASPLETFGKGAGDCEDFSIAKYTLLKKLGVSQDKLRLTYVRARMPSGFIRPHMVLAYYSNPSSDPLILDNLNFELLPASKRSDLSPVFSFNDKGLFVANNPNMRAGSPANISKWRDVLTRMRQDGLE
ncbi:transglutaminase-like cysteine peptidase [Methylophilus medardicus]|uniref:Transglutaminase n=1 Tax=Methylophilus medardicus TaxID=2588534 RepID=A0A5B8CTG1_9PROT|nr:transglutaminase-like cysteine peptidase [Methylophilus medardicus]QDC44390.1 transglutaminase [Methylophilus medardicus]QDC49397.1 transglutaminase [Methylophilus medardicus]QDC53102.1 transglutaminase [Methylophilus medardicus]